MTDFLETIFIKKEHMKQSEIFLKTEADAWYRRNKDRLGLLPDKVMSAIEMAGIVPTSVFEFGCCDGRRLVRMKQKYKCACVGLEPSWAALYEGRAEANKHGVHLFQGTCESFEIALADPYNMVIFGFCLYLCDRESLFKIAATTDRLLDDNGYLVIHDFQTDDPHSVVYEHADGLKSYHMDYAKMFLWNPQYRMTEYFAPSRFGEDAVCILRKQPIEKAFPERS